MSLQLLIDLHKDGPRQGPGSDEHTRRAISLSGLTENKSRLKIADIGCGTGASTLVLAKEFDADITAVDLFPTFLEVLVEQAKFENLSDKITPLACSMVDLPFERESLDAIWSEGAVYNIGFEKGITAFSEFLKPGGILAVSEITWLTAERPDELSNFWNKEYPEIALVSEKIRVLEQAGFILKGYFPLPVSCWMNGYYIPLQERMDQFLSHHASEEAKALVADQLAELELYKKFKNYFSYGFYIAEKN